MTKAETIAALEARYGKFMTVHQVAADMHVSTSKVYRMVHDTLNFPAPVHLRPNMSRWRTAEYGNWIYHLSK